MLPSLRGTAASTLFLRDPDTALALDLWDRHSGAPGLLNAAPASSAREFGYVYDPEKDKYINLATGRAVSEKDLRRYVFNVSREASTRMKKSTQQLIAGVILLAAWYESMRSLMSALYRTVFILSLGGFLFEDDTARNVFYLLMLPQLGRLDNFERQLEIGRQKLDGSALNRAGLYGSYGNGLWQNVGLEKAPKKGYTEAKNILGITDDHCHNENDRPGCLEVTEKGWMPIQEMPAVGARTCYSNCLCRVIYR